MPGALEWVSNTLASERGESVLDVLARIGQGAQPDPSNAELTAEFEHAGLGRVTGAGFRPNDLGQKCADAAREYRFWLDRKRKIHGEDDHPALRLENFRDQRVLEIGPSWGCNLFRIRSVTAHARGVEIEPTYISFAEIFARREGVTPPEIDLGRAETLPYADASFDSVLCFSSLEYTDLRVALREIERVLVPGGSVVFSFPALTRIVVDLWQSRFDPGRFRYYATALINSISYGYLGRRLFGAVEGRSTARPVHLPLKRVFALVKAAGLQVRLEHTTCVHRTLTIVADKPNGPVHPRSSAAAVATSGA